jgi:hypothetical protein
MDFPGSIRQLDLGQTVFLFGVVGRLDGYRAQRDHLRTGNNPDLLAARRPGQPGAKILSGIRDRQGFHGCH